MRRSTSSALAAAFLLALAGGSRGGPDSGDSLPTVDSDTGYGPRQAVLIYYGHGGVGPGGLDGSMTHTESTALLQGASLTVTHTDSWPASFEPYRLVILTAPGATDTQAEFDAVERADLLGVMNAGGVVVVEAEPGTLLNDEVLNALVWDLGGSMYTTGESLDGPASAWGEHTLTDDVTSVGLDVSTAVERGEETCLLETEDHCVAVAADSGAGWLVLVGDGNMLSDVARWSDGALDNASFLFNLAQLD
jgi:hypothetical protein